METPAAPAPVATLPVTYAGAHREYPVDILRQRRLTHYLVHIDGIAVRYESDGVDGLYTSLPTGPAAALPPMGLVHAVKSALLSMMPA